MNFSVLLLRLWEPRYSSSSTVCIGTGATVVMTITVSTRNVHPRAFISCTIPITDAAELNSNIVVTEMPQILLSILYLNYNGLMAVASLAHEWPRYGIGRNGLRVCTTPKTHKEPLILCSCHIDLAYQPSSSQAAACHVTVEEMDERSAEKNSC